MAKSVYYLNFARKSHIQRSKLYAQDLLRAMIGALKFRYLFFQNIFKLKLSICYVFKCCKFNMFVRARNFLHNF